MENLIRNFLETCLIEARNTLFTNDTYTIFKATYNINRTASNASITLDKMSQLSILENTEQFLKRNSLEIIDTITDCHLRNLLLELEEKSLISKR